MSKNAGGWWTCWGCGNSQPGYVANSGTPRYTDRPSGAGPE